MTIRGTALNLCLGVVFALGSSGCKQKPEAKEDKKTECGFVLPQSKDNIQEFVEYTGRTAAVASVDVKARVTGFLLASDPSLSELVDRFGFPDWVTGILLASDPPLFKEGEVVHKGQKLFLIDPRPYEAQLQQAQAQVDLYTAQVEDTSVTYAKAKELNDKSPRDRPAFSDLQMRSMEAQVKIARAGLDGAKASLKISQLNKGYTTVTAPISGVVGRRNVTPGNVITQDQTLLTTVVSLDKMFVYFDMDAPTHARFDQAKLEKGAKSPISLELPAGSPSEANAPASKLTGNIDFLNNQFNPATDTLLVRGVFENPTKKEGGFRMKPGMFVRVRVSIGEPYTALVVPDRAIISKMGKKYVYVIGDGNKVKEIPVVTGQLQEEGLRVIIPGELTAKDRVIVTRLLDIQPNQEIVPVPPPAATK